MVGIILKLLATQVAGLLTLGNDANTRIIDQRFSWDRLGLFKKTNLFEPRFRKSVIDFRKAF